jgi:hypothetical protein
MGLGPARVSGSGDEGGDGGGELRLVNARLGFRDPVLFRQEGNMVRWMQII